MTKLRHCGERLAAARGRICKPFLYGQGKFQLLLPGESGNDLTAGFLPRRDDRNDEPRTKPALQHWTKRGIERAVPHGANHQRTAASESIEQMNQLLLGTMFANQTMQIVDGEKL